MTDNQTRIALDEAQEKLEGWFDAAYERLGDDPEPKLVERTFAPMRAATTMNRMIQVQLFSAGDDVQTWLLIHLEQDSNDPLDVFLQSRNAHDLVEVITPIYGGSLYSFAEHIAQTWDD